MFKTGQKVRVKEGLVVDQQLNGGCTLAGSMAEYRGKEFEVKKWWIISADEIRYELKDNSWTWSDDMLEPATTFKLGDRVRIIDINPTYPQKIEAKKGFIIGAIGNIAQESCPSMFENFDVVSITIDGVRDSIPVSCIEKVKTVWAKESDFHGITKGKSYDVLEEGMSLGSPFYRIDCDKGVGMNFLTYHFSEEPPKEEKAPAPDEPMHYCHDCKYYELPVTKYPCSECDKISNSPRHWISKDAPNDIAEASLQCTALFTVVFVTHDEDKALPFQRNYLFGVPDGITITKGDKLFADTKKGRKLVTAVTGSFRLDKAGIDSMDILYGAKGELKMIVARAERQEEWKEVAL